MTSENALIIRGADGEVYFLGHNDLANYRLSPENAAAANQALDEAEAAGEPEVSGFSRDTGGATPKVHGNNFTSIVYAPVMKGYDFATATPDAFVADSPPAH